MTINVETEFGGFVLGTGRDGSVYIDSYDDWAGEEDPVLEHVSNLSLDEATRLLIALDIIVTEAEEQDDVSCVAIKGDER